MALTQNILYRATENFKFIYTKRGAIITDYTGPADIDTLTIPNVLHYANASAVVYKVGESDFGSIFRHCHPCKIKNIRINDDIQCVTSTAFEGSPAYAGTSPSDDVYIDNILISVNAKTDGDYHVRNGTRIIAEDAFFCTRIKKIYVPESVRNICDYAFAHFSALEEIYVAGNPEVEANAFVDLFHNIKLHCKKGTRIHELALANNKNPQNTKINIDPIQSKLSSFLEKNELHAERSDL